MGRTLPEMEPGEKAVTKSKIITLTDIETFTNITRIGSPLFLHEDYAKSVGWKTRLSPGPLTFSCSIGLMENAGLFEDAIALLAMDKLRFTAPVYPYDTITVYVELLSKRLTKNGDKWLTNYKWEAKNQHSETLIEAEGTTMFKVKEKA